MSPLWDAWLPQIRQMDDVLVCANNMRMLEQRKEKMLEVCLKKNMKLHPDTLQIGRKVTFGEVTIEAFKSEENLHVTKLGETPSIPLPEDPTV